MKYKQWQVASPCPEGQLALERAGYPPLLAGLLAARGVSGLEEARRLLAHFFIKGCEWVRRRSFPTPCCCGTWTGRRPG